MDISKLPPPTSPEAGYIRPASEFASRANRFTFDEIEYNCAVGSARRARGEEQPIAHKLATPRLNGWRTQFELLR